jgi:Uma2 family endonuclease
MIVANGAICYLVGGGIDMIATRRPHRQKLILDNVSWKEYTRLLHTFEGRHLRLTYDQGMLEIMTLSHQHEGLGWFLDKLVFVLTEELNLPIKGGGSTTFRKKKKHKGLEADNCYWIAHEAEVRGKSVIKLSIDPPPDLAIEVDISRSSMNRMRIYAAIKVPEVWRHDRNGLTFFVLNSVGKYDPVAVSPVFPMSIAPADLLPFVALRDQLDENAVLRQFREWIRNKVAASQP